LYSQAYSETDYQDELKSGKIPDEYARIWFDGIWTVTDAIDPDRETIRAFYESERSEEIPEGYIVYVSETGHNEFMVKYMTPERADALDNPKTKAKFQTAAELHELMKQGKAKKIESGNSKTDEA